LIGLLGGGARPGRLSAALSRRSRCDQSRSLAGLRSGKPAQLFRHVSVLGAEDPVITNPLNPAVHQALTAAGQCLQRRDVAGAERALAPVMALGATVPAVQQMLGIVRLYQGQFGLAAELLAKARAAMPKDPMLGYHEGLALAGLGRFADALARFRAALVLKPDFMEARFETGRLLHHTGSLAGAEQAF